MPLHTLVKLFNEVIRGQHVTRVLTAGGTVRVKELEVIAHAIACRGRGIQYYRCQLPTSITCRVKWPLRMVRDRESNESTTVVDVVPLH